MATHPELIVSSACSIQDGGEDGNDDAEEVTETKIIGVTETGVIRKRSFKRKLTKEEKAKRGYGNDKAEYIKIVERTMAERIFSGTIEGLQERYKMLKYMHLDCMDMVEQWIRRREEILQKRRSKDMDGIIAMIIACSLFLGICWIMSCLW